MSKVLYFSIALLLEPIEVMVHGANQASQLSGLCIMQLNIERSPMHLRAYGFSLRQTIRVAVASRSPSLPTMEQHSVAGCGKWQLPEFQVLAVIIFTGQERSGSVSEALRGVAA